MVNLCYSSSEGRAQVWQTDFAVNVALEWGCVPTKSMMVVNFTKTTSKFRFFLEIKIYCEQWRRFYRNKESFYVSINRNTCLPNHKIVGQNFFCFKNYEVEGLTLLILLKLVSYSGIFLKRK